MTVFQEQLFEVLELYNWDSVTLKIISVCQNVNRAMYGSTVYPLKKNLAKVLQKCQKVRRKDESQELCS